MRTHLLPAAAALAVTALVAGCGGSDGAADATRAAAAPRAPTPSAGGSSPSAPAAASAVRPSASTRQQVAASPQPAQQQPAARSGPRGTTPGSAATAAGTYTYDSSGTVTVGTPRDVSGTATLTVDRPAAGQQHSLLESQQGRTEQDVVVRPGGTFLARLAISNPAFSKEFRPAQPVLLVPAPATPGRSWSWTATSTDGKTKAALTARVTRTETLTIGGVRTTTSVVESTLRLTGDVTYTGQMQTWYDAAHRLTVKDHTRGDGTVNGFAFRTDITSVLRSTRPS